MHDETPPDRGDRGTSVPNEWGNRLAQHWAAEIPRTLTGGWLRTMYALRAIAHSDGQLRYRGGDTITLRKIAAAARADERDVRRWLAAAIAAGIVTAPATRGSRTGHATRYSLTIAPKPNWKAAEAVELQGRRRGRAPVLWPTRTDVDDIDITAAAAEDIEHTGARDTDTDPAPTSTGHRAPTPTPGHRAPTPSPTSTGHRAPTPHGAPRPEDPGAPRPDQPGNDHELHQDVVAYGTEVQTAHTHELAGDGLDGDAGHRPALAPVPDAPPGTRTRGRAVPPGQPPLLMTVPTQPPPARVTGDLVQRQGWRSAFGLLPEARPHPQTGT